VTKYKSSNTKNYNTTSAQQQSSVGLFSQEKIMDEVIRKKNMRKRKRKQDTRSINKQVIRKTNTQTTI